MTEHVPQGPHVLQPLHGPFWHCSVCSGSPRQAGMEVYLVSWASVVHSLDLDRVPAPQVVEHPVQPPQLLHEEHGP